jgi:hypothetical protein
MLAVLAAESGNPLAGLTGRVGTTGGKVGLMVGGAAALAVVLFMTMTMVGALLL